MLLFLSYYRSTQAHLYLECEADDDGKEVLGHASCVTRFISSLILLLEHGARIHMRHLSEFFGLLFEFSRMGDEETMYLLRIGVIKSVVDFYLGNKTQDCVSGELEILFDSRSLTFYFFLDT